MQGDKHKRITVTALSTVAGRDAGENAIVTEKDGGFSAVNA